MIAKEKISFNPSYSYMFGYLASDNGQFSVFNSKLNRCTGFHQCRELFSGYFRRNTKFIAFYKSDISIKNIDSFFNYVEKSLNLEENTVFIQTNQKNCIVIKVPDFWLENAFKRGMFTLLLRCAACHFNGKDFIKALEHYELSKPILPAIQWFLKGNTNLTLKRSYGTFRTLTRYNYYYDSYTLRKDYKDILTVPA